MATSVEKIKQRYPLPVYNYRVSVLPSGRASQSNTVFLLSCTEISGLQMEIDKVIYRHGLSFLTGYHIIPAQPKEVQLNIRKGVTANGAYFSDWMQLSYPQLKSGPASVLRKRDLLIDLCNEEGFPLVRWTVSGAMPLKLSAPSFKVDTSEVAFEQLDLIAHELKVEYDLQIN